MRRSSSRSSLSDSSTSFLIENWKSSALGGARLLTASAIPSLARHGSCWIAAHRAKSKRLMFALNSMISRLSRAISRTLSSSIEFSMGRVATPMVDSAGESSKGAPPARF